MSSLKLTKPQMAQIRDYVRDHGGGLMMLGGEESFGLGGYYRTPIEEALPVTMDVKQKVEIPSLAVVLSIDRSGSMAMSTDEKITKLDLAKEAAHLVVDLLDERNEVGVQSWDTEFIWDAPVRPARDKAAIHHAIATIKAGGGTDGYPALKESYAVLFERPALLKHVIFLSDGQMTRGDFQGLLRRMVEGQDHRVDGGDRQGRRRPAHGRRRQVGARALLLHRGLADDPAHLHAGDAARLQGLARRAAVQAAAHRARATRRCRRSTGRTCRRSAATWPPR